MHIYLTPNFGFLQVLSKLSVLPERHSPDIFLFPSIPPSLLRFLIWSMLFFFFLQTCLFICLLAAGLFYLFSKPPLIKMEVTSKCHWCCMQMMHLSMAWNKIPGYYFPIMNCFTNNLLHKRVPEKKKNCWIILPLFLFLWSQMKNPVNPQCLV